MKKDNTTLRVCAVLLLAAGSTLAGAQNFADLKSSPVDYARGSLAPKQACAALGAYQGTEILQLTATPIPAVAGVPAHCRVRGTILPEIGFELNLPVRWNGRFYMIGNGGLAGETPDEPVRAALRAEALKHSFAMASTNTGHDAAKEPVASFALNNAQKVVDYAYRAVHLTALNSKRMANAYYGQPVSFAYWNGCSTGGRQGLMSAQRFWDDFNGVIAGAPVLDFGGKTIHGLWVGKAFADAPIAPGKLKIIADAVYGRCDKLDGLTDGVIDDPRRCDFDPGRDLPQCVGGVDGGACFTPAQVGTLRKVYGGVVSNGKPYFPGYSPGAEIAAPGAFGPGANSGWLRSLVVPGSDKPVGLLYSESTMKYMVYPNDRPDFDYRAFDYDRDTGDLDGLRALADATNPDLSRFRKRGGKVLMYFGWADNLLPPMMGVQYYERAAQANSPDSEDFLRLFMVPGMFHCRGGPGPDQFDPVTALVNWVERGKAPASIVARKFEGERLVRSRPLCPYPQVARYQGKGSSDEAKNFRCASSVNRP